MRFLRSLSVATSMIVIALIGFIVVSVYAQLQIYGDWQHSKSLEMDMRLTSLSTSIGGLTHELQKERGASAGFIASKGSNFADTLKKQRGLSDAEIEAYHVAVEEVVGNVVPSEKLSTMIKEVEAQISELPALRTSVDQLNIELLDAVGKITKLNRDAIGLLPEMAKQISFAPAANAVQRHAILMTAKDIAGLERATGASGFSLAQKGDGVFPANVKNRFNALSAEMNVLMNIYRRIASDELLVSINNLSKAESSIRVDEMRGHVNADAKDQIALISPETWFETSTAVINQIKSIEDQGADEITNHMSTATAHAVLILQEEFVAFAGIAAVYLTLSCFFVVIARNALMRTSRRVVELADGDIDSDIFQPLQSDLNKITTALESFRLGEVERRAQTNLQKQLEESSADGIKRISEAVSEGDFEHRLRLRDLSGATMILGQGINEILQVSEAFVQKQRKRDLELLEQQRLEAETQKKATRNLYVVVQACSKGDFTKQMSAEGLDESWIEVANGINSISSTTAAALSDIRRIMQGLSAGRLDERMDSTYEGTFAEISAATNTSLDKLRDAFLEIDQAIGSVGQTASKLRLGTNDLAQRSGDQAQSVDASKHATDQLSDTIGTNQSSLQDCRGIMKALEVQTDRSQDVAKGAINSMSAIETASTEMNKIVATIEEIAFQTNLLALNASVEAARAGEAGKGFSVVASEVRSLATRCSTASNQISELISESVQEVALGSDNVKQTGDAIHGIQSTLEDVLTRIETVATAGEAQKLGVSSLEDAIQQLGVAAQSNLALAKENSDLMDTLSSLELRLTSTVSGFLDDQMRSAATQQISSAA